MKRNIFLLVAQQKKGGLSHRTIKIYIVTLHRYYGITEPSFGELLRVLQVDCLGAKRRHAEDFDDKSLAQMLVELDALNPWVSVVATLMLWLGLRYFDLQFLSADDIEVGPAESTENRSPAFLRVNVSRTKAIRTELLRTELVVPLALCPPFFAVRQ